MIPSLMLIIGLSLLSFSFRYGGDSFELYLNKKLVVQQFLLQDRAIRSVDLSREDLNKQMELRYSHCGAMGKSRTVYVKDAENRIRKTWQFGDGSPMMAIAVKELAAAGSKNENALQLFYSSKELPGGKLLATIVLPVDKTVKLR